MKVLIIGYGSIGKRHADILSKNKKIKEIKILTKQKLKNFVTISNLDDILFFNPEYVIIANETNLHLNYFNFLNRNFKNLKILIEKPLFHKFIKYQKNNNQIFVGYNLRFHPFILHIKKLVYKKKIWLINVIAGSYLPNWRKSKNYKNSYSAKNLSGGVLLDLSHELDYISWIFGNFKTLYKVYNKYSDLKIKSKDYLNLTAIGTNKSIINISLSYFFKTPIRQIIVEGKNISINADLINNKLIVYKNNNIKKYNLNSYDTNNMYKDQHDEILNNKIKNICTYKEGNKLMKIIEGISKL